MLAGQAQMVCSKPVQRWMCPVLPLFHQRSSRASFEPVANFFQQPKNYWHKHLAGLEPRATYISCWGRDYHDQQDLMYTDVYSDTMP